MSYKLKSLFNTYNYIKPPLRVLYASFEARKIPEYPSSPESRSFNPTLFPVLSCLVSIDIPKIPVVVFVNGVILVPRCTKVNRLVSDFNHKLFI